VLGIDPTQKKLTVPLDHLRNPQTLDNVGADAYDLQRHSFSSTQNRTRIYADETDFRRSENLNPRTSARSA
jgi:hypothetical protein